VFILNHWNILNGKLIKQTKLIKAPTYFMNNIGKKGYLFDDVDAVLFVVALSDFAVYNKNIKKNAMKHSMEIYAKTVNSKWFRRNGGFLMNDFHHHQTEIILLLNKYDIFREQIKSGISLSECFDVDDGWNAERDYGNINKILIVPYIARCVGEQNGMEIPMDIVQEIQKFVNITDKEEDELDKYCEDALLFIRNKFLEINIKNQNKLPFCHTLCAIDQDNVQRVFWDIRNILIRRGS